MKHEIGDQYELDTYLQCTCDKCKDWSKYGKWFTFEPEFINEHILISSVHYPPETFMTKDERIEYFKEIEIDIKEHPEKYTVALAYRKMMGIKTRSPNGEYKK